MAFASKLKVKHRMGFTPFVNHSRLINLREHHRAVRVFEVDVSMVSLVGSSKVAQAFNRFGFGGGLYDAIPKDPVSWLKSQLTSSDPAPISGMMTTAEAMALVSSYTLAPQTSPTKTALGAEFLTTLVSDIQALYVNAVTTASPFRERLVWFWFNHFAIMTNNGNALLPVAAGPYVREAIRPYVTGNFADMLVAVMHHPAMLCSLNNDQSYGPASPYAIALAKQGQYRNINENLARETLELFTVGAGSGYTQADVDALAYLLTGFKVSVEQAPLGYYFDPKWAQPGEQTLLGNTYQGTDAGCTAALRSLAINPATCLHIATKLVTHFVSDTPNSADILAVANVFESSGGDLLSTSEALINLASAWTPLTKVRTPSDLLIAVMRATGTTAAQVPALYSTVSSMGSLPFGTDFPNGWSDQGADWTGPEQMLLRLNWIFWFVDEFKQRGQTQPTVASVIDCSVLPFLSTSTAEAIASDKNTIDQLFILFSSPEFQRR